MKRRKGCAWDAEQRNVMAKLGLEMQSNGNEYSSNEWQRNGGAERGKALRSEGTAKNRVE